MGSLDEESVTSGSVAEVLQGASKSWCYVRAKLDGMIFLQMTGKVPDYEVRGCTTRIQEKSHFDYECCLTFGLRCYREAQEV